MKTLSGIGWDRKEKKEMVSEIAYEVGFNNLSYFAKCFRKAYGMNHSDLLPA